MIPNQRFEFRGCNIDALGWLTDDKGYPVRLNVADKTVASFQIVLASGTYATAAITTYLGNDASAPHVAGTAITAPSGNPHVKHTGAIDVSGYSSIGLQVTTKEGSAATVDVFALVKETNS